MSNNSVVFDRLLVLLVGLFPTKTRIPYPYELIENNKRFLENGYGLIIGSSTFEPTEFCSYVNSKEVTVVFTKEVYRTDSDAVVIDDIVKSLMEDIDKTQREFFNANELGIPANIMRVDITSISGVEQVIGDKQSFLSMRCSFNFLIQEKL